MLIHDQSQAGEVIRRREIESGNRDVPELPLAALPISQKKDYHRESESIIGNQTIQMSYDIEAEIEEEQQTEGVDVKKIADMVYRMMRQDMVIEQERRPGSRRGH